MAPLPFALSALVSGLLALERKAFLQAMASRPLIAGCLVGLAFARPIEGLSVGAMLELFFLGGVNMGAALPDNELFAAVAASSCACALSDSIGPPTPSALALSTLVALPAAKLGKLADRLSERVNAWAAAQAQSDGPMSARLKHNLYGLWLPFASTAAAALAGGFLGRFVLAPALAASPRPLTRALGFAWGALLLTAAAVALRSIRTARAGLVAGVSAAVAAGAQVLRMLAP